MNTTRNRMTENALESQIATLNMKYNAFAAKLGNKNVDQQNLKSLLERVSGQRDELRRQLEIVCSSKY